MRRIFILLALVFSFVQGFSQGGNDPNKYTWYRYLYGNRTARLWADTVNNIPADTIYSKDGVARIGSTLYVGNGTKWTATASGIIDTSLFLRKPLVTGGASDSIVTVSNGVSGKRATDFYIINDTTITQNGGFKLGTGSKIQTDTLKIGGASTGLSTDSVLVKGTDGVVKKVNQANFKQIFSPFLVFDTVPGTNPTIPNAAETEIIMQSNATTADMWYRATSGAFNADSIIYYTTATNGLLNNWTLPGTIISQKGFFPSMTHKGSTYYMFIKQRKQEGLPPDFNEGDIYFYSSTDKINWTVLNSGNPVIIHSSDPNSWYHKIYNVGAVIIGTTIHLLVEGKSDTSSGAYSLGYALADISNPVFSLTSAPQILNGSNPNLIHVEKNNSLLVMYSEGFFYPTYYKVLTRFAKSSLTTTLTNENAWSISPFIPTTLADTALNGPHYPADFSIAFTPGKTYPAMVTYSYDQLKGYQAYMPLVNDELCLFESVPDYPTSDQIPTFSLNQWKNVTGGINYPAGKVGIGQTTPAFALDILTAANSSQLIKIRNNSSGASAIAGLSISNNIGSASEHGVSSSGYTPFGVLGANTAYHYSNIDQVYIADGTTFKWGTTSGAEKMRLTTAGNLGIGITNPTRLLEVGGDAAITPNVNGAAGLIIRNQNASGVSVIGFDGISQASAANPTIYSDRNFLVLNSKAGAPLYLQGDNSNSASTVDFFLGKVVVTQSGRLGINKSVPLQKLHVGGQVQIDTLTNGTAGTDSVVVVNGGVLKKVLGTGLTSYTFSGGVTNTSGTVTNDLITPTSGSKTIYGGSGTGNSVTIESNNTGTKGTVVLGSNGGGTVSILGYLTVPYTESPSTSLTLGAGVAWISTNTATATWTLPDISSSSFNGVVYWIKNEGTNNLIINAAAGDDIYTTSAVTTVTLLPGESIQIQSNATTRWHVL